MTRGATDRRSPLLPPTHTQSLHRVSHVHGPNTSSETDENHFMIHDIRPRQNGCFSFIVFPSGQVAASVALPGDTPTARPRSASIFSSSALHSPSSALRTLLCPWVECRFVCVQVQ
jgi:hypothetical protein